MFCCPPAAQLWTSTAAPARSPTSSCAAATCRAIWSGTISFGLVSVPVHIYSSAESRSSAASGATVATEAASANQEKPRWGAPPPERDWAPYPSVAEQPDDEAAVGPVEARPGARAKAAVVKAEPAAETPDAGSTADGGFLPRTGLEIAALAAIGLGVLTLGVALRPRRRERARALR